MKTFIKAICVTAFVAGIFINTNTVKAEDADMPEPPLPIQNLVAGGAQLRYLGQDLGMNGWLVLKSGQEQYFYSSPDGQAVIMGVLFNNKGDTITLRQINDLRKKEGPAIDRLAGYPEPIKPDSTKIAVTPPSAVVEKDFTNPQSLIKTATKSKAEQLLEGAENANWIKLGNDSAPIIYTFIDPECPHCHDFINALRKEGYLKNGLVQVRIIPVGVLSDKSLAEAAFLLASPTAEDDFYKHLDGQKNALTVDENNNTQGVQRNIKLMQDWKLDVTPFTVYRARDGKIKILQGMPDDLKQMITELR